MTLEAYGILIHYNDADQQDKVHNTLNNLIHRLRQKNIYIGTMNAMRNIENGTVLYYFFDHASNFIYPNEELSNEIKEDIKKGSLYEVHKEPARFISEEMKEHYELFKESLLVDKICCQVGCFIFKTPNQTSSRYSSMSAESINRLVKEEMTK